MEAIGILVTNYILFETDVTCVSLNYFFMIPNIIKPAIH